MDKLVVKDKKVHNTSCYILEGVGLTFEDFTDEEKQASFMTSFTIAMSSGKEYKGKDIADLMRCLRQIKLDYCLTTYTKDNKDILIIYTDRLWELSCYLYHNTTERFPKYFQVLDNIEFRSCWEKDIHDASEIAEWSKFYQDNLFTKFGYWYLTPSQIFRKRIKKTCTVNDITVGHKIFPAYFPDFNFIKKGLFGGICYCPYPMKVFEQPIIEIDLKSAYIYCFLKKHCSSPLRDVDEKYWEIYLKNPEKLSIGKYRITYTSWSSKVSCYKNIDGEHCKPTVEGHPFTDTFIMNNTDLWLFINTVNVTGIECLDLVETDLDYLPKEIIDLVLEAYKNKEKAKPGEERKLMKVILNAIYGNTIRKVEDIFDFNDREENDVLAPQWGILITSYCKELVLTLGSKLDGWLYSDTDSIFCFDTPENQRKIEAFNKKTRETVKNICDMYGYNFEDYKDLGCFMIEEHITKFKAWKQKQYVFTRKNPKYDKKTKKWVWMVKKAAGCNRDVVVDDSIYEKNEVPIGEKVIHKFFNDFPAKVIKDGKEYFSETSYYIMKVNCEENKNTLALMELAYYLTGELPY